MRFEVGFWIDEATSKEDFINQVVQEEFRLGLHNVIAVEWGYKEGKFIGLTADLTKVEALLHPCDWVREYAQNYTDSDWLMNHIVKLVETVDHKKGHYKWHCKTIKEPK